MAPEVFLSMPTYLARGLHRAGRATTVPSMLLGNLELYHSSSQNLPIEIHPWFVAAILDCYEFIESLFVDAEHDFRFGNDFCSRRQFPNRSKTNWARLRVVLRVERKRDGGMCRSRGNRHRCGTTHV